MQTLFYISEELRQVIYCLATGAVKTVRFFTNPFAEGYIGKT